MGRFAWLGGLVMGIYFLWFFVSDDLHACGHVTKRLRKCKADITILF